VFVAVAVVGGGLLVAAPAAVAGPCDAPVQPIVCENSKPGSPASEWDIVGAGSTTIQGFASDMSYAPGGVVRFRVKTPATDYRFDIYRMGYYGGLGARKIATVQPSAALPQSQPGCKKVTSTGLIDCGNWKVSGSWTIPSGSVSGIYFAKLVREDGTTGTSHIVFVVRDDTGASDLLFQTADTTWQAYNNYGGNSLYQGNPVGRAYKVSYNRPFNTRATHPMDWVFNSEYPMVRWLEANGYDVSYSTGVDTARRGGELLEHDVFLSVGHDEYWSGNQRANVEAARDAGVHLAFFSGNEVFWKTRWENSVTGSPTTAYRTLVSYKESKAGAKIDPSPEWTGTWRDARFSPPSDGGRPENALTGNLFTVNGPRNDPMTVPQADGRMRFWRGTSVASLGAGQVANFAAGILGVEWDEDIDNGVRPAGRVPLSRTTIDVPARLADECCTYVAGPATHSLSLYRAPSGALVFGAGTYQWPWGLDGNHDRGASTPDVRIQQATVNLFADMGVQPATLQPGLAAATQTTDTVGPGVSIASPIAGAELTNGVPVTIAGTSTDVDGGVVGAVEVSVDNGATWHPASGREAWTYSWTPSSDGPVTIRARASDDSANLGSPVSRAVTVSGGGGGSGCPCSIWSDSSAPAAFAADANAVELGVKFRSDVAGTITGIRFYKGSANTGTHVGSLWSRTGALLARATFTSESASGWQTVTFSSPVSIAAGTTYVASYHTTVGKYGLTQYAFTSAGVDSPPLHALQNGVDGGNGVYKYTATPGFPNTASNKQANYWVDVVFDDGGGGGGGGGDTTPPQVVATSPVAGATNVAAGAVVTADFDEDVAPGSISFTLNGPSGAVTGVTAYDAGARRASFDPNAALAAGSYTATVSASDLAGNPMSAPATWSFSVPVTYPCPCSIWSDSSAPAVFAADANAVELGVKFRSDVAGTITGIRFYKGSANTGTHVGSLWSRTGTLLAQATFTSESASGWQTVTFSSPVSIAAGTTYVASYHTTVGKYAETQYAFTSAGVDTPPLHALRSGVDGVNGVYKYSATPGFPNTSSNKQSNYWVDVVFETS
jgi:hypothetical protein